jgi:hypothetical protein
MMRAMSDFARAAKTSCKTAVISITGITTIILPAGPGGRD